MVLGSYYLTLDRDNDLGEERYLLLLKRQEWHMTMNAWVPVRK